jgi:hypothetical protein
MREIFPNFLTVCEKFTCEKPFPDIRPTVFASRSSVPPPLQYSDSRQDVSAATLNQRPTLEARARELRCSPIFKDVSANEIT